MKSTAQEVAAGLQPGPTRNWVGEPVTRARMIGDAGAHELRRITAIVVTYNSADHIDRLLDSIPAAAEGFDVNVIVVDNDSVDGTAQHVRSRGDAQVINVGRNRGYAAGINVGRTRAAPGTVLAILNPDLELGPGSLRALAETLADPAVGVAVPLVLDPEGRTYPSLRREPTVMRGLGDALFGRRLASRPAALSDTVLDAQDYTTERDVDWASGAIWVVSSLCNEAVGPWDERFFLYSEETDYARRVRRAGWRIRFQPAAVVRHIGGASGSSAELAALMEINRIQDFRSCHGPVRAAAYGVVVLLRAALRGTKPTQRKVVRVLISSRRSRALFSAERAQASQ